MLRRIVLENFMSHAYTVIEPADGLTVLVGPNNCGKSAVVSALQTLCTNDKGDYMVRHGERETRVTVETDDGHVIVWRRGRDGVSYVIDGAEFNRLSGKTPERLHELLKLPQVRADESDRDGFDIHFAPQKAPIFLLNESEQRAAVFFASSSDAALLMRMQQRHKEKAQEGRREHTRLDCDLRRLDAEVAALAPVADVSPKLVELETTFERIGVQDAELDRLAAAVRSVDRSLADRAMHQSNVAALASLAAPPLIADTLPLESHVDSLCDTVEHFDVASERLAVMAELAAPPTLTDVSELELLAGNLAAESDRLATTRELAVSLAALQAAPELRPTGELEQVISALAKEERRIKRQQVAHTALEPLNQPPALGEIAPFGQFLRDFAAALDASERTAESQRLLADLGEPPSLLETEPTSRTLAELEEAEKNQAAADQTLRVTTLEMEAVMAQIRVWVQENPTCGFCGAAIDPERLIVAGHAHE